MATDARLPRLPPREKGVSSFPFGFLSFGFRPLHRPVPLCDPDQEADFYILRHTLPPAVLVENFFMDSRADCDFLLSPEGQEAIVNVLVAGICRYVSMHT